MKMSEIRERNDEELSTLLRQLQEDLYRLRVQRATNQLENTSGLNNMRKELARVQTVLQARKLGVEPAKG